MNRVTKLLDQLPEMLRRDAAGEPPLVAPDDPLQYARFVVPGIPATPWHDAAALPWTSAFEAKHAELRAELDAFLAQQDVTFRNYVGPILGERADAGEWHVLYLDYRGHRWDEHTRHFPKLMALVDTIPRRSGTVFVSRLTPGTHIPKHCGGTNTQLTCHFGLVVPDGVEMRVARETRRQAEGRCVVFDDSFEHEVWNHAATPRYNVFTQFWHPDLSDEEIAGIQQIEQHGQIQHVIERYREGASALAHVRN
jgi:aspartyl/asparaginyl beta-hydroxylase (cupin superfamily)